MTKKSVAKEAEEILLATGMIQLGARLQVLQAGVSVFLWARRFNNFTLWPV